MSSSERTLDPTATPLAAKSDEELQLLLAAVVKEYARRQQEGDEPFGAFAAGQGDVITGTDAVIAASAILEGASVEIFELGMWQAWGTV